MITSIQAYLTGAVVEETIDGLGEVTQPASEIAAPLERTLRLLAILRPVYGPQLHYWFVQLEVPRLLWERSTLQMLAAPGLGGSPHQWRAAEDRSELLQFWRSSREGPNASRTRLALRHWSSAADRRLQSDQLLDYWIALESLLVTKGDLKSRSASVRGAKILAHSTSERQRWYDHFRLSYDWRSTLVHGGDVTSEVENQNLADIVRKTGEALQLIIREILSRPDAFSPKQINLVDRQVRICRDRGEGRYGDGACTSGIG